MAATTTFSKLKPVQTVQHLSWGRRATASSFAHLGSIIIIPILLLWTHANWVALQFFEGSLTASLRELFALGPTFFVYRYLPVPNSTVAVGYLTWVLFQALLYTILPGTKCYGQRTPGGHLLEYTSNGLLAWALCHVAYSILAYQFDPACIAREWEALMFSANVFAFVVAGLLYFKAHTAPSYSTDNKFSGSAPFDFAFGVELNPRLGEKWDLKFFFNGRPGIVAWTLIDLSWAAYQYQTHGLVTNSMIVVIMLHTIYVVDFFWNEDWYTRTIDITHDHLGWILVWGDVVLLPSFYTLQAQYLARFADEHLPATYAGLALAIGLSGYIMFRSANNQRNAARRDHNTQIWGKPIRIIQCAYRTIDGKEHENTLLTSGWWGIVRHPNYLADLVQSFAMCAVCGFEHILPWSYFIYMVILLVCRALRDDRKCRCKYGKAWDTYCDLVPYQILPGLW